MALRPATVAAPQLYTPLECAQPPLPIAPITDPLPSERRALEMARKREDDETRNVEAKVKAEQQKEKGGLLNKLGAVASEYSTKAQIAGGSAFVSAEDKAAKMAEEHATKRFHAAFPTLADTERVLADHACRVLSASGPIHTLVGHLDVTPDFLCFLGDDKVTFSIPLADVVSIQRVVTLDTEDGGVPHVMQIPRPDVVPTAIAVYTRLGHLHVFDRVKGLRDALNVLDHAWRAAAGGKIPVPGIPYAEGP